MSHASSPRSGMLNHKLSEVFSLVCTLGNSNTAITIHLLQFRICSRVKTLKVSCGHSSWLLRIVWSLILTYLDVSAPCEHIFKKATLFKHNKGSYLDCVLVYPFGLMFVWRIILADTLIKSLATKREETEKDALHFYFSWSCCSKLNRFWQRNWKMSCILLDSSDSNYKINLTFGNRWLKFVVLWYLKSIKFSKSSCNYSTCTCAANLLGMMKGNFFKKRQT